MEFPDLHEFPNDSPPSPYGKPLLVVKVGDGLLPKGPKLQAVGWIEKPGFTTGAVPKECIAALVKALQGGIFNDGYRGYHTCTMCGKFLPEIRWKRRRIVLEGHGHYLVQLGKIIYIAPALLLHYIIDHHYCPPKEFLEAVSDGKFLTQEDLVVQWRAPGEGDLA